MNATAIQNALNVLEAGSLDVDLCYAIVRCADYSVYSTLPAAIEFEGKRYGKSGWNSDTCKCFYRTDVRVAFAVKG